MIGNQKILIWISYMHQIKIQLNNLNYYRKEIVSTQSEAMIARSQEQKRNVIFRKEMRNYR